MDLTTLTPEQLQKTIPEIAKFIRSGSDMYSDGVDEIVDWRLEDGILTGVFVDKRPVGDRYFNFEINGHRGTCSFWPAGRFEGMDG